MYVYKRFVIINLQIEKKKFMHPVLILSLRREIQNRVQDTYSYYISAEITFRRRKHFSWCITIGQAEK